MALIKANAAPKVVSFSMVDIETQARGILVRAQQKADQLLAEAMKEGESLKQKLAEEGRADGLAEGRAKGLEEGTAAGQAQALDASREELKALVETLKTTVSEIDAARRNLEAEALREVVEL